MTVDAIVMRDATYSAETQAELKILLALLERFKMWPEQAVALRDVVERWEANDATEFTPICGACGASSDDVRDRGWTDEGRPMATCEKCGSPDLGAGA